MEHIRLLVDYGIISVLIVMSVLSFAVALERRNFYRNINLREFKDKKTLELLLTKRLHIIATVGSNAPYVGLLGTVLGIMFTFSNIGREGIANTSSVMIGLALALKATAIGLLVAIPSVVLYNFLLRRAKEILMRWEIENGG